MTDSRDELPLVTVIIVTWNSAAEIAECLAAVQKQSHTPIETIVVDNDSRDGTPELIGKAFPGIRLIRSDTNQGYAGGNNTGLRAGRGKYILLLNPDCILREDFISMLTQALERHPQAGSASGTLLRGDGHTIDSTGLQVNLARLSPRDRGEGRPHKDEGTAGEILGPSGAAAFYRRAALEETAMGEEILDEDFFAYYEDVDLAWRLQLRGWTSVHVPEAVAIHDRKGPAIKGDRVFWTGFINRYFLLIKNASIHELLYGGVRLLPREAGRLLKCLVLRRGGSSALMRFLRLLPRMLGKRRVIRRGARVTDFKVYRFDK